MNLPILAEITAIYDAITDADIARAAMSLSAESKGEEVLGQILRLEAQRVFAASHKLTGMAMQSAADARFVADGPDRAEELKRQGQRYQEMADFARDLFWLTCKDDIGGSVWERGGVGVRQGWILVATKNDNPGAAIISKLLGVDLP